jgi:hypothetical protein
LLGQKVDPNQPDSTDKDVPDHACQRNRTGVARALFDDSEPTSLVIASSRLDARALACKRRLHPEVRGNTVPPHTERASLPVHAQTRDMQAIVWRPSFGSVIGALANFVLTALIWHRGNWLLDKAVRWWDVLKMATLHVVCHGFVLCLAGWHAPGRRADERKFGAAPPLWAPLRTLAALPNLGVFDAQLSAHSSLRILKSDILPPLDAHVAVHSTHNMQPIV